jgi:hypothetical protein
MFIVPHGAPEGYEWFVALVVLVGLYFAVRNFMRAHPPSPPKYMKKAWPLLGLQRDRPRPTEERHVMDENSSPSGQANGRAVRSALRERHRPFAEGASKPGA